jgi:hypothetical protein
MQYQNLIGKSVLQLSRWLSLQPAEAAEVETNQRRIAALTNGINRTGQRLDETMDMSCNFSIFGSAFT